MTNPYDQREREPRYTICPDCGEDLEWHICGQKPADPAIETIVRHVVEQHDGLCLDTQEEREQLIRALSLALTRAHASA